MSDPNIGRKAYKKTGYFSGLIGVVEKSSEITEYIIVFYGKDGSRRGGVGANLRDIEFVDGEESE